MPKTSSSALVANEGANVHLRIDGKHFQLTHDELRDILKLPPTKTRGVGITIDDEVFQFEFAEGDTAEVSAKQIQRRLTRDVLTRA